MTEEQELRSRRARSFGARAAEYAEHRPDYPIEGLRWGLPDGTQHVVDVGSGTGKLTEGLLSLGVRVTAVEPDPGMRCEFARRLPDVPVTEGTAERIPLPDGAADAVLAGQAFHWFDVGPALTEIARVMRPGGRFVALWNRDDFAVPWVAEFAELTRTDVSRAWASHATELPEHELFGPFEREQFPHAHRRTAQTLVDTVSTHSHMLVASAAEQAATKARMLAFLQANPDTAEGEFDLPLVTIAIRAERR